MKKNILYLLSFILFISCQSKRKADLLFFNGKIYTIDSSFSMAESFAVSDGKIIGVGSTKDLLKEFDATETHDLKGQPVYPGFIDAHCHFFGYASDLTKADLYGTKSFDEIMEKLIVFSKTNKFSWLLGRGWDQNDWETKEFPTKEKLDSLFPNTPVFLMRIDGHAVLCNETALKVANITAGTRVKGGEIILENGQLTGVLIDNAVELVRKNIPPFSRELNARCILEAQKNCFAAGLTTVDDAALGRDSIELLSELQQSGQLKLRLYVMVLATEENKKYYFKRGPVKTDRLNIRAFKVYVDGALGSRGACLLQPYSDKKGHSGFLLEDKKHLENLAAQMIEHGFQFCSHSLGDSANRIMLQIYAENLKGKNDRRWRIEHCQVVHPDDFKLFGENSIIPSVQPTHATSDMYWAGDRLGKERLKTSFAYRELMENAGGIIAFGTDFPVENINPIYTFYAAVARKDLKGFPEHGFQPENKIERKDALRAMTIMAAYSNFEEHEKGSIEKGKFADFVILDSDIMQVDENEIPKTKVVATYVNGEKVFGEKQ